MTVLVLFYIFAALSIIGAFCVITAKHPVRAVLSLVATFVLVACTWLLLEVEYLALVLVVVYVGAVMVLFMFVVMMLDTEVEAKKASIVRHWPFALVIGVLVIALLVWAVGPVHFGLKVVPAPASYPADYSSIAVLGQLLFTKYLYPFELAAILLLAAMIAAITLTFRGRRPGVRGTAPHKQIHVQAKDRLRVVKMAAEPKSRANQSGDQ